MEPTGIHRLENALEDAFAELAPMGPIEPLGAGFNSRAVVTTDGKVFRIGQTREAAAGYELEASALPELRRHLGSCVPEFLGYSPPNRLLPFGAICTSRLPGKHPEWNRNPPKTLLNDLGVFVANLHGLPLDLLPSPAVPQRNPLVNVLGAQSRLMATLQSWLSSSEYELMERWWSDLETESHGWSWTSQLSHLDLWHENLLIDQSGKLCGVLDWSSLAISDPAADFAPIKYFGGGAFNTVVESYIDSGGNWSDVMAHRAKRYFEGRELEGLLWAIDHDEQAEAEDSISKFRRGPILN